MNIAVFASHNGSDLQALIDGCKSGKIKGQVCAVISNNQDAYALERARNENISNYCINVKSYPEANGVTCKILEVLDRHKIDIIFLAGYLKKISPEIINKYENKIFNIHPALLPKYGGKGMFGMNVHTAVIEAKEKISGITIHRVNKKYDEGDIIAKTQVEVLDTDTAESLAERILSREHTFLVEIMSDIAAGKIKT